MKILMNESIRQSLINAASELGFSLHGICPAVESTGFSRMAEWIDKGYAANMDYFANRLDAYRHPDGVLQGTRSIVVLTFPYATAESPALQPGHGRVARYAWTGKDYHDVIHPKLKKLRSVITEHAPSATTRGIVDTAPLMEREFARLAGLGWRGKNTLLLNKTHGSYFFLACLLTDIELPYDPAHETGHCGTCTACLDACPTDAFPSAGVMDASKCISYLTIEHRKQIELALRPGIGDWLFGCDICQQVCPWNTRPTRRSSDTETYPLSEVDLAELFAITDEEFRAKFRKTPFWRTRRRGILRNAAIVLGNQRNPQSVSCLKQGLCDAESIVRGASAWALGQIGGTAATQALESRLPIEDDPEVTQEIQQALQQAIA